MGEGREGVEGRAERERRKGGNRRKGEGREGGCRERRMEGGEEVGRGGRVASFPGSPQKMGEERAW